MNKTYFLRLQSVPMENKGKVFAYTHFPYIEPFNSSLEALQKQVGGYIEHFIISPDLNDRYIDMWIDEEGKYKDLHPTFALCDEEGTGLDCIMGNCVFTRYDREGETLGLTDEDITAVFQWLEHLEFVPIGKYKDGALEYAWKVNGFTSYK